MGDIADDMIEGACCSQCGIYFEEDHGYPVLCEDCFVSDDGESGTPLATNAEL
jgi:NMD protein affecting ribosome stability and mRNA decay